MAIQLIKSGLIIFGEWLAVGGCGGGEISKRVEKWGELLKVDAEVRGSLFLAYGRAFLHLSQGGEEARGVWRGILSCDDLSQQEENVVKSVFSGLLRSNGAAACEEIFDAVENEESKGGREVSGGCGWSGSERSDSIIFPAVWSTDISHTFRARSPQFDGLARSVDELVPKDSGVKVVAKYCLALALQHAGATKEMVRVVREKLSKEGKKSKKGEYTPAMHMASVLLCCGNKQADEELDDMVEYGERGWGEFGKVLNKVRDHNIMVA